MTPYLLFLGLVIFGHWNHTMKPYFMYLKMYTQWPQRTLTVHLISDCVLVLTLSVQQLVEQVTPG